MINYNITPANPLGGLSNITGDYIKKAGEKKLLDDAAEVFKTGSTDEVANFMIKNPQSAAALDKATGFKSEATKNNLIQTSLDILNGINPDEAIQKRVDEVEAQGGDASHTRELQGRVQGNPEAAKQNALMALAVHSPAAYKAYMDSQPKVEKPTTLMQNLQAAGLQPGTAEYQQAIMGYIKKPSGSTITIGDAKVLEKATEGQLSSAGFASKVAAANAELDSIEDSGYDPSNIKSAVATSVPGGGYLLDDNASLYESAKTDYITAVLRDESGATIGTDEYKLEEKKSFPRPGDSKAVIEAKRKRRKRQLSVLKNQSKGVYDIQYEKPSERTIPVDQMSDEELMKGL